MINNNFITDIGNTISKVTDNDFKITEMEEVNGGDINQSYIVKGKTLSYFLKINQNKPKDFFEKEADGLHMLAMAKHSLKIPKPLAWGESETYQYLVMDYLPQNHTGAGFFEKLGKGMAELHKNTKHYFGLQDNNYLGSQPQENGKYENWSDFYAKKRLLPQAKRAFDNQLLSANDIASIEHLSNELVNLLPKEQPSLLHGDFWNGNFGFTRDLPCIFDPAVYYGSREIDIAMSLLFGGFDPPFYSSYNATFPLIAGWEKRVGIYQLYPLLMHLNHFGKGYYDKVFQIISKY